MTTLIFVFLLHGAVRADTKLADEFGHNLHVFGWTPAREREAAEILARRDFHAFPGNAWDLLSSAIPLRQNLTSLELREIDWLIRLLGHDLPALRCEELREELTGVAKRTRSLKDDTSEEAPLRRLVHLNVEIFARLIDRAARADQASARRWVLKALGVMTRTHLTIAANDGRRESSRFLPASFDRRRVARELHEAFWRQASDLIAAPDWLNRTEPEWRGVDRAAERLMEFVFLLGSGAETKRCWQLLSTKTAS